MNDGEAGYGKPPVRMRFRKGQSGNPAGRPKRRLSPTDLLLRTLREKVTVHENGKRRKISKLEVILKQLVNKAAAADPKAIQTLLTTMRAMEGQMLQGELTRVTPPRIEIHFTDGKEAE